MVVMDRHSPPRSESSTSDDDEESRPNEDEKEDKNITNVERELIAAVNPTKGRRLCSKEDICKTFVERRSVLRTEIVHIPPVRGNKDASEDYTEVFLCRARLYLFAESTTSSP